MVESSDISYQVRELLELTDKRLEQAYRDYAEAKEQFFRLKNKKKGIFISCMNFFDGTVTEKERKAEACKEYKEYLDKLSFAYGAEEKAKSKIEYIKTRIDALRTSISLSKSLI